ncbi:hypothetical protein CB0940_04622 [Cercospora beticola]|uniref:Something about silencing protein 4 domain-containing protein n=1 Tax=Cercospora beticola TaxID=122368 RepID=A0A2G5HK21_CERBT|nr:hypothetical protein CB0940_04622 [Cercospora beticola]PIA92906.1 hypothetical protein CB0940_04622 [Cercospora beticola]WPB01878.1 hypothetical protein RHO25_006510 [Cercospora beticola]CAK1363277.1 unnamed protein product [Cercospora beticola]
MPVQSRERAPGGHAVAVHAPHHAPRPHHPLQHHHHRIADAHEPPRPDSPDTIQVLPRTFGVPANGSHVAPAKDEELPGQPAKKKRKLSIRTTNNHRLESFGFGAQPKPPAIITRAAPHSQLRQTINGVTTALNVDEDELSRPPTPDRMPKRVTPSPAPATAPPTAQPVQTAPEKRKKEDRRSLRSQDEGPRLKSELAVYFANYEDVMFDAPTEEEDFLTVDSSLYIAEDTAKRKDGEPSPAKSKKGTPRKASANGTTTPATPSRSASHMTIASPSVNLDFLAKTLSETPDDPLTDEHFLKTHNRAERKEKQLRNIERERAMHEKVQLERLLDGLQGHDWLKVLGITGITDGEAKRYQKKRDYFISEVQALIDKFAQWKEQERRLRMRKEAAQARLDAATDEGDSTASSVEPPSSDLNASAARQLQQETVNAVKASASSKSKGKLPMYNATSATSKASTPLSTPGLIRTMPPPLPPSPEVPITSFYSKRHLRDAALSKSRQTTRNVTAFGHPVPDLPEQEFALPEELTTPDALRARARERRRRKRESVAKTSGS